MTNHNLTPLFREIEPPPGLIPMIFARISRERERVARVRLLAFGSVIVASLLLLIPAVQYALNEFYASGFYDYATLLSDSLLKGYSNELFYALADSLPSLALLLLGIIGAALVWSLIHANRDARIAFGHASATA
jgi:hypothetical protein